MSIIKYLILIISLANAPISIGYDKISKHLENQLNSEETVEIYLLLENKYPFQSYSGNNRLDRIRNSITQLKRNAQLSQQLLKVKIESLTSEHQFYWINNSLWAKVSSTNARELIKSPTIRKAFSNTASQIKLIDQKTQNKAIQGIEWNINLINAPSVWKMGIKGQNVILAGHDTGFQWDHPSLINQYLGWNGQSVNHNYHWHDAIRNPITSCLDALNQPASCDDHGHGSHTMGIMLGDDGKGNQIGVAPSARWIGCRGMNQGIGTPATYTECFQFFLAPTDTNNLNADITKTPHIINNSWECTVSEDCVQPDALESVVNNVVQAGILVVAAAGNSGPGCNTVESPPAIYRQSLTIGSSTFDDEISGFSSQGSVIVDASNRIKPDMVAPGSNIRSTQLNGSYITNSGTSMAAPHVAGVAALMISANPDMAGKPKILKQVLLRSSQAKTTQQSCSGIVGSQRPNNTFGWGRLDALSAVNQIKDIIYLENFEEY